MAERLPCPHERCLHTLKIGSLTRPGLYFCRCQDAEVVKIAPLPGLYGTVLGIVKPTPAEAEEFKGRAPRSQWPQSPHPAHRAPAPAEK